MHDALEVLEMKQSCILNSPPCPQRSSLLDCNLHSEHTHDKVIIETTQVGRSILIAMHNKDSLTSTIFDINTRRVVQPTSPTQPATFGLA